ncbi:hypothetical protein GGI12_005376 [Dipsacomyces acuminosporus]|nr:hypothetical protein GGI12_005376 [Dipsacomyces acuminosporus]
MFLRSVASHIICVIGIANIVFADPLIVRQQQQQQEWLDKVIGSDATVSSLLATPHSEVYYFDQKVDHFGLNSTTFKQRLYINGDNYVPGGPVYLINSGEGAASPHWVNGGETFSLANATKGLIIMMEHRYYGESYPVSDLSGPNMKYLTVENALEDMAYFIRNAAGFVNSTIGVPVSPKSKWVVTGGSYPANLAVWMRLKYPDLVHAAYASSGPVLIEEDFYQYDQVVGRALPCANSIALAIQQLDVILDSRIQPWIDQWKKSFGLQGLSNDDFAGALTDQLSGTVQYHVPPVAGSNKTDSFTTLCNWFSRKQYSPLQNFADMTVKYIHDNNIDAATYYNSLASAKDISLHQDGRAWFYQTCTQFGYWQSAPRFPMRRLRSKYVTAKYISMPCEAYFGKGITGHIDEKGINRKLGGLNPNVTRVVFVNGLYDPWSSLSIVADRNPSEEVTVKEGKNVVITMKKASHCADFSLPNTRTDFGVNIAKEKILQAMTKFLAE